MKCPECEKLTDVIDSRRSSDGNTVRRRRYCHHCKTRFTTYESAIVQKLEPDVRLQVRNIRKSLEKIQDLFHLTRQRRKP